MAILGRVRTVWTGVAGSPYYTNLYFLTDSGGGDLQTAVDAWTAFLDANDTNFTADLSLAVEPDVPLIDSTTGLLVGNATVAPSTVTPAGGGEKLPLFTQALVKTTTAIIANGRRVRGRIFLPGMQETNNTTDGVPSGALVAGINSSFATFLAAAEPATLQVFSRTHFVTGAVNDGSMWTQWSVLRSRRD